MMSFDVFLRDPSEKDDVLFECRNELTDRRESVTLGKAWSGIEPEKLEHAGEDSRRGRESQVSTKKDAN
jgi:hypothetical protein